jgi:hypothetical protein
MSKIDNFMRKDQQRRQPEAESVQTVINRNRPAYQDMGGEIPVAGKSLKPQFMKPPPKIKRERIDNTPLRFNASDDEIDVEALQDRDNLQEFEEDDFEDDVDDDVRAGPAPGQASPLRTERKSKTVMTSVYLVYLDDTLIFRSNNLEIVLNELEEEIGRGLDISRVSLYHRLKLKMGLTVE